MMHMNALRLSGWKQSGRPLPTRVVRGRQSLFLMQVEWVNLCGVGAWGRALGSVRLLQEFLRRCVPLLPAYRATTSLLERF